MAVASNSKTRNHVQNRSVEDGSANLGWIAVVVIVPLLTLLVMLWVLVRQLRSQRSQRRRKSRRSSTSSQPESGNLALPAPVHPASTAETISSTTGVFGDSYNPYDNYTGSITGPDDITWTCPTCGATNVAGTHANWHQDQQPTTFYHDSTNCPRCISRVEKAKRRRRRDKGDVRREHLDRYLQQQQAAYNDTLQPGPGQYCYRYQYLATTQEKDEYWYNQHMDQSGTNYVSEDTLTGWPDLPRVYRRDNRGRNGLADAFAFQTA